MDSKLLSVKSFKHIVTFSVILTASVVPAVARAVYSNENDLFLSSTNISSTNSIYRKAASSFLKAEQVVPSQIAQGVSLTGRWFCNDGGTYFIRQVGSEVWWYGRSSDGSYWSNVFKGQIQGNTISGSWADVPVGQNMLNGRLQLQIVSPNKLRAVVKSGGFGGSEWTR